MFNKSLYKYLGVFFITLSLLLGAYFSLSHFKSKQTEQLLIAQIKSRIALDLDYLNLPDPFLNHVGSEESVNEYITNLNQQLGKQTRVLVHSIAAITPYDAPANTTTHQLVTPKRSINVILSIQSSTVKTADVWVVIAALLAALLTSCWYRYISKCVQRSKGRQDDLAIEQQSQPILLINLQTKSIAASPLAEKQVHLANKPLCFYLALIEFCIENPEASLNQNKDVPEPLIELANKYFYRLIELGHTIRKRPNFTNSLEKTLSEIRAALDEALVDFPELKERYYPPKAHGEGSRSRLHSYGLSKITLQDIEVIGK